MRLTFRAREKAVVKNLSSALLQSKYSDTSRLPKINKSRFNVNHIPISIPYLEQGYHRNITTVNAKFKWHFDSYNPDQSALHKQKSFPNNKYNTLRILPVRYNIAKGWSTNPGGGQGEELPYMDYIDRVQLRDERTCHLKGYGF